MVNDPFSAMKVASPEVWLTSPAHEGPLLIWHAHPGGRHDEYIHTVSWPGLTGAGLFGLSAVVTPNRVPLSAPPFGPCTYRSLPVGAPIRRSSLPTPWMMKRVQGFICSVFTCITETALGFAASVKISRSVVVMHGLPFPPPVPFGRVIFRKLHEGTQFWIETELVTTFRSVTLGLLYAGSAGAAQMGPGGVEKTPPWTWVAHPPAQVMVPAAVALPVNFWGLFVSPKITAGDVWLVEMEMVPLDATSPKIWMLSGPWMLSWFRAQMP